MIIVIVMTFIKATFLFAVLPAELNAAFRMVSTLPAMWNKKMTTCD